MTISSTDIDTSYSGDDATSEFTFSFKVWADTHVTVIKKNDTSSAEETLTLDSDYTVTRNADQEASPGGSITLIGTETPSDSDYTYWIIANIPNTTSYDPTEGGGFSVDSVETAIDRLTMQTIQNALGVSRTPKITVADYNGGGVSLDIPTPEASKLIGFNAAANALALYTATTVIGASTDLSDFPSALVASKILQVKADGSGWELVDATVTVSDTAFAASWNGVTTIAPSKNAVYDKVNLLAAKGANSDITSLAGLTTALSVAQGGTAETTADWKVKGWIHFAGTGVISTKDSFNVSSITDNGTGDYTVTWDTDFANTNYAITGSCASSNFLSSATKATGSTAVKSNSHAGVETDDASVCVIAIGDQ